MRVQILEFSSFLFKNPEKFHKDTIKALSSSEKLGGGYYEC
jgi:hypothetical protein